LFSHYIIQEIIETNQVYKMLKFNKNKKKNKSIENNIKWKFKEKINSNILIICFSANER
jgi:hypothetical protein